MTPWPFFSPSRPPGSMLSGLQGRSLPWGSVASHAFHQPPLLLELVILCVLPLLALGSTLPLQEQNQPVLPLSVPSLQQSPPRPEVATTFQTGSRSWWGQTPRVQGPRWPGLEALRVTADLWQTCRRGQGCHGSLPESKQLMLLGASTTPGRKIKH